MTSATRARLIAKGLLDAEGNVTPAGEAWTLAEIAKLRRQVAANDRDSKRVRWRT